MYMKPNNAGKNKWLWAQTLKRKLKQNAQTQDAVLYTTQLEAISQHY